MITTKPGGIVRIQTKAYKDLKVQALKGEPVPMLVEEVPSTASSSRGGLQIKDGTEPGEAKKPRKAEEPSEAEKPSEAEVPGEAGVEGKAEIEAPIEPEAIEPEAIEVKADEAPIEPEAIEVKSYEAQGKEVAQPSEPSEAQSSEAQPRKKWTRPLLAVAPPLDLDAWKAARQEEGWEPEAVVSFRYNCGTRAGQVRKGTFVDFLTTSKRGPGMQLQEAVGFRTYIWSEMSDVSFEAHAPEPAQTVAEEAFPGKCISCVKLVKALHNGRCARCSMCPHGVDLSFYSGCSTCTRMSGFRAPKAAMEFQISCEIQKEGSEARRMAGEDVILVAMAREGRRMAMSDVNVTLAMEWYRMKANDLCAPAVERLEEMEAGPEPRPKRELPENEEPAPAKRARKTRQAPQDNMPEVLEELRQKAMEFTQYVSALQNRSESGAPTVSVQAVRRVQRELEKFMAA
jgi:hypothetical protein